MTAVTPRKCCCQLLTGTFPFFRTFLHQLPISLAELSQSSSPCVIALFSRSAGDQGESWLRHLPRLVSKAAWPHREPSLEHRHSDPMHGRMELSDADFTAGTWRKALLSSRPELVYLGFLSIPHAPVQCLKAETTQGYKTNCHLLTPSLCDC